VPSVEEVSYRTLRGASGGRGFVEAGFLRGITMKQAKIFFVVLGMAFIVLYFGCSCSKGGNGIHQDQGGNGIDPEQGGKLTAEDGASVEFPQDFGKGTVTGSFVKETDATGEELDERKAVTGEYRLTITGAAGINSHLIVSIPVRVDLMPEGWKPFHLQPEYFDETGGEWVPTGDMVMFDESTSMGIFDISVNPGVTLDEEAINNASGAITASLTSQTGALDSDQFDRKYRIRVYYFSNALTVTAPGSNFSITYYPSSLGKKYSVKKDEEWNSQTGNAEDPMIPDFIEDLDAALNEAFNKLLEVQKTNEKLFAPPKVPIEVLVTDLGEDAGESPIGGPMKISNHRIEGWEDMKTVAAHELVHVFQGQYYTGGTTGNVINTILSGNRWFLEASANYYAAKVMGLDDSQKRKFYTKDGNTEYLCISLTSPSDNSMYTAAHFLDWISDTYGEEVIGDAMSGSGTALTSLSNALKSNGEAEGVSGAFEKYGEYLIQNPEGYAKMNQLIREVMTNYFRSKEYLSGFVFKGAQMFIKLERKMPVMSMIYAEIYADNESPALLVMDTSKTSGSLLKSMTYDFVGQSSSDYANKKPLEEILAPPYKIKNFGKNGSCKTFSQFIMNYSPASTASVSNSYYILIPPVVKSVQDGAVLWSTKEVGNIPRDYISGYNVNKKEASGFIRLNNKPIGLPSSGEEQSYIDNTIKSVDEIVVDIVDKFGNIWPETGAGEQGLMEKLKGMKFAYLSIQFKAIMKMTYQNGDTETYPKTLWIPTPCFPVTWSDLSFSGAGEATGNGSYGDYSGTLSGSVSKDGKTITNISFVFNKKNIYTHSISTSNIQATVADVPYHQESNEGVEYLCTNVHEHITDLTYTSEDKQESGTSTETTDKSQLQADAESLFQFNFLRDKSLCPIQ